MINVKALFLFFEKTLGLAKYPVNSKIFVFSNNINER